MTAISSRARAALCPIVLGIAALAASTAHAQQASNDQNATQLDRVFVTATRTPIPFSQVLSEAIVLQREDIQRLGYGDVSDLLRSTGAFELARTGGPGQSTSLYLRGADNSSIMVLIDGVRIDTQSTGGAQWESIPAEQIERIEIVKGPASAIYGSDAIGGVVQIITRKGHGAPQVSIGVTAGSLRTGSAEASILGSSGILDYAVAARSEHSDGFQLVTDPTNYNYNPDRAGYQKHDASVRLGASPSAQDRVDFLLLSSHLTAQFNNYAPALDTDVEETSAARLSWRHQWSADLSTQASVGESRSRYEITDGSYASTTEIRSYALQGDYRLTSAQRLLFLVERREDQLDGNTLTLAGPGSAQRHEDAAALGYLWQLGELDLQAHARHDQDSEFGSATTGSLALGWRLSQAWKLVGSVANAFRAPTIYQNTSVYGPLSVAGGQSLKAETGHNTEMGLRYDDGTSEASATVYRNLVDNLINFGSGTRCLSNSYGCYGNVAAARLEGVTLSASTGGETMRITSTLNLQSPKDRSTGDLLPRRARQYGSIGVTTVQQGWKLGATLLASSSRWDGSYTNATMGGYALLNLDASSEIARGLRLQINLDNALNRAYQTAAGYAQAPRTVLVGLHYTPSF